MLSPTSTRLGACSDSKQGKGDAPQEGDQIVIDYTGVSEATGKIFGGSRNFSFIVGEEDPQVRQLQVPCWWPITTSHSKVLEGLQPTHRFHTPTVHTHGRAKRTCRW